MEKTTKRKHMIEVLVCTLVFVLLLAFSILWYARATEKPVTVTPPAPTAQTVAGEEQITVHGTIGCLQPRDKEGMHTMECAFGLTDDAGNSYALQDTDPTYSHISSVATGARVAITGVFTPDESIQYDSIGTLTVKTLTAE